MNKRMNGLSDNVTSWAAHRRQKKTKQITMRSQRGFYEIVFFCMLLLFLQTLNFQSWILLDMGVLLIGSCCCCCCPLYHTLFCLPISSFMLSLMLLIDVVLDESSMSLISSLILFLKLSLKLSSMSSLKMSLILCVIVSLTFFLCCPW